MGEIDSTVAFFLIVVAFCIGYWVVSKLFKKYSPPKFEGGPQNQQNNTRGNNSYQRDKRNPHEYSETHDSERNNYFDNILELRGDHSVQNIKRNYREKQAKYHPDKVNHLGYEFQEIAEKKAREINQAYEFFKRRYNFS